MKKMGCICIKHACLILWPGFTYDYLLEISCFPPSLLLQQLCWTHQVCISEDVWEWRGHRLPLSSPSHKDRIKLRK